MKETVPAIWRHAGGITTVDAEYVRPRYASVHVIERDGRAALVDSGSNHSVPFVLRALAELGIEPARVDALFVTHAHLDHAGGAGRLMNVLPNARAIAHPRAAPHLRDPAKLEAATRAVYGDARYEELYGSLVPIAAERLVETSDGDRMRIGESEFAILHTPGHALHHHVLHDLDTASVFTGDTFGLSYRWLDSARGACIFPTTTPTQFDPEQLTESIGRVLALQPHALFLTHYGRVEQVAELGASLIEQIGELVAIARKLAATPDAYQAIFSEMRELWHRRLERHGVQVDAEVDELLASDLALNTQGLIAWLARAKR